MYYLDANEYVDLPATAAETSELLEIIVRECGCGCTSVNGDLTSTRPTCGAVRLVRDRRFVLGILFARTLRAQLRDEEWRRERARVRGSQLE
jgi:hypothetical protein